MKTLILTILSLITFGELKAQSYYQYVIATNTTTTVNYSVISTGSSAYTTSNPGILPQNLSTDSSRSFIPLDMVNDPSAFPWRMAVKVGDCSGILIDPYHVLTAGHVVDLSPAFGSVKVIAGYNNGEMPFAFAYPSVVYRPTLYSISGANDYAVIKLDRPLGSLTGWAGFGYNNTNSYFTLNKFFNPSYPSAAPFDGKYMYNWKNSFDAVYTEYINSIRSGIAGMSGSAAYSVVSGNNVAFGILTSSGIKFNRITASKYDLINKVITDNTPAVFDAIPVWMKSYPEVIKNNSAPDSVVFYIHNYSSAAANNFSMLVDIYISNDSIITTADTKLKTESVSGNFSAKGSLKFKVTGLSSISKPNGNYFIGAVISGDNTTSNNITGSNDVNRITVSSDDMISITGRVTSTQSGNGISGVTMGGLTYSTVTDFNGYYTARVPLGWSGTITPSKTGFTFNSSSTSYSNVTSNQETNYTTAKQTFTITVNVKSPVAQTPVWGLRLCGLPGDIYTTANTSSYSFTVYYGFAARFTPAKSTWKTVPNLVDYTAVTSNKTEDLTCGIYISGFTYNCMWQRMPYVSLSGFPSSVTSDGTGSYTAMLDSNWSGTVTAVKGYLGFNPTNRTYTNLSASQTLQSFNQLNAPAINAKLFLSGAYYSGSDTMQTILNYKNLLKPYPPDTLSGRNNIFVYKRKSWDTVSSTFFSSNRNIVDWVILMIRDAGYNTVDTVAALLRNDGRVLSIFGDTLIQLRPSTASASYYITVLHRNHLAVMSSTAVSLAYNSAMYNFSNGANQFFGGEAKLLKAGLFGMFSGDANRDGRIDDSDFLVYDDDNTNALAGYQVCDFNFDGFVTSGDFVILAPNKRNLLATKIP